MATIKKKVAPSWEAIEGSRFLLAPLNPIDAVDLKNETSYKKGKIIFSGEGIRIALRGVRDWQEVRDEDGNEVAFSSMFLEELPVLALQQIAAHVFVRTFLSETERKNSSSLST